MTLSRNDQLRSINRKFNVVGGMVLENDLLPVYFNINGRISEIDTEGVTLPFIRKYWGEVQMVIDHPHSSKALYKGHPGSTHGGDVTAVLGIIVVIVEIKTGCPKVEFVGFCGVANLGRQYCVDTG